MIAIVDGKKKCSRCKLLLPVELFSKTGPLKCGYNSRCKQCDRDRQLSLLENMSEEEVKNRNERCKVANRKSYCKHKEKYLNYYKTKKTKIRIIERKYGLCEGAYKELLDSQDNKCAICESEFGDTKKVHVDHCHTTGKVRGILCQYCNIGLGSMKDDIDVLYKAIKYLTKSIQNKV